MFNVRLTMCTYLFMRYSQIAYLTLTLTITLTLTQNTTHHTMGFDKKVLSEGSGVCINC